MVLDVVSGSQTYDRDSRTRESNINLLEEKEKVENIILKETCVVLVDKRWRRR